MTDVISVATGTFKSKVLNRKYPVDEGLILGTTKIDGRAQNLIPEESDIPINSPKREGI